MSEYSLATLNKQTKVPNIYLYCVQDCRVILTMLSLIMSLVQLLCPLLVQLFPNCTQIHVITYTNNSSLLIFHSNLHLDSFLQATPEIHTMAKFLMELCLTEYSMLCFLPSHLAAAALNLAMKAYSAGEWVRQEFNIGHA